MCVYLNTTCRGQNTACLYLNTTCRGQYTVCVYLNTTCVAELYNVRTIQVHAVCNISCVCLNTI